VKLYECGARSRRRPPKYRHLGESTATTRNVAYRLAKVRTHLLPRGEWLDIGCGDGGYALRLLGLGARRVIGVDVEPQRIEDARLRYAGNPQLEFVIGDASSLAVPDDSFDGVLMNEVLEHVDDTRALSESWRVLRPGGHLALFSPNRLFPFEGHGLRLTASRGLGFPVPIVPWLPHRFTARFAQARNYWPWELRQLVEDAGFTVVTASGVLPVFERYRWAPGRLIAVYTRHMGRLGELPLVRHFGVSTFVLAKKATLPESPHTASQR
jgi:ubiquinone/menaquinone biosynthesis C-methylase UbiE